MEGLFEELVGFLMREEEDESSGVVNVDINPYQYHDHDHPWGETDNAAGLILDDNDIDHHDKMMMMMMRMSSSSNCSSDDQHHHKDNDCSSSYQLLDLENYCDDHQQHLMGGLASVHNPSEDIQSLLLDFNDYDSNLHFLQTPIIQSDQSSLIPNFDDDIDNVLVTDDHELLLNNNQQQITEDQEQRSLIDQEQKQPELLVEPLIPVHHHQSKRRKKQKLEEKKQQEEEDDEEEEDENLCVDHHDDIDIDIDNDQSSIVSKNLMSERNRRKRLNQQLFTLRSIVPNITKMDKRSVLVDALAYLQNILHQTQTEIEKQKIFSTSTTSPTATHHDQDSNFSSSMIMADDSSSPSSLLSFENPHQTDQKIKKNVCVEKETQTVSVVLEDPVVLPYERCAIFPAITKMEAEKVDEERYLLKILYNKAIGAMGQVQRCVEMLGFNFINVSISNYDQDNMQSSNFLHVKKKGSILVTDEENLLNRLRTNAKQLGLHLPSSN